ncbi:hypothetical protein MAR621_04093 [Maribacter dokdonensis]|nr:hypothetical protein MAR621_04093 [Maribacter dokdonensis]
MTLNQNKKSLKIARLYIISLVCIVGYFLMENDNIINILVEKSSDFFPVEVTGKFITLVFTGLLQYGLLVVGICIFLILSFILFSEKIKSY